MNRAPAIPARLSPARLAFALMAVLILLITPAPSAGGRAAQAPPARHPFQPVRYDINAVYDPSGAVLRVTCTMEISFLEDQRDGRVFAPARMELVSFESDDARWSEPFRSGGPWPAGGSCRVSYVFEGTPEDYYAEQNRYWSRATSEAIWLTHYRVWLPYTMGMNPWAAEWHVSLTMPETWTVFFGSAGEPTVFESGAGLVTYHVASPAGSAGQPWNWFAGPYNLTGAGRHGPVSWEVWGLPDHAPTAGGLAAEMPLMLTYLEGFLGLLPERTVRMVTLPLEQGGGVALGGSHSPGALVGVTPYAPCRAAAGRQTAEQLWVHELTHALAAFRPDEGLADTAANLYLAHRGPDGTYVAAMAARRRAFLEAYARYGDRIVSVAAPAHASGEVVPSWHAFCYVKPSLVWSMFREVFGEETFTRVIHELNRRAAACDFSQGLRSCPEWWDLGEEVVREIAGAGARDFYHHWMKEAHYLDLTVAQATVSPIGEQGENSGDPSRRLTFGIQAVDLEGQPLVPGPEWLWTAAPRLEIGVRVRVPGEGGDLELLLYRVDLPETGRLVELTVPGQPVEVLLDPRQWLLDYNPINNTYLIGTEEDDGLRSLLRPVIAVLLAALIVFLALRRRPVRLASPPRFGSMKL